MTAAIHILKTVGLYGEVKQNFGPDTPEEVVWKQATEKKLHIYTALRPDLYNRLDRHRGRSRQYFRLFSVYAT